MAPSRVAVDSPNLTLVVPAADDDRTAEGLGGGRRAGARVEWSGGGVVRATEVTAQL